MGRARGRIGRRSTRLKLLLGGFCGIALLDAAIPTAALAQKSVAEVLGRTATPEGEPRSYLEEIALFSYIENSYVANLGRTGRGNVNELRFYDHDHGYTFNAAELSVKKDPSERYRLGWGVVLPAGNHPPKNHPPGLFRDNGASSPFFPHTAHDDPPAASRSPPLPRGEGVPPTARHGR